MSDLSRKIRDVRQRRGLNQADFAREIGVTQGTVSKWENGTQVPDTRAAARLAEWSNKNVSEFFSQKSDFDFISPNEDTTIRIVGAVETGHWVQNTEWNRADQMEFQIPFKHEWFGSVLKGYIVRDEFIEQIYPLGSIVLCADKSDVEDIGNHDRVLVIKQNMEGLYELTIRELARYKDKILSLRAHSRNPDLSQNFSLKPLQPHPDLKDVWVAGVVVASFIFEPHRPLGGEPGFTRLLYGRD